VLEMVLRPNEHWHRLQRGWTLVWRPLYRRGQL